MQLQLLKEEITQALRLGARERFKKLKQLGYQALGHYKALKDPNADELKEYIEIFKVILKVPAISTDFNIALAKATSKYLTLIGCENAPILFKKSSKIYLHGAQIAIGDPAYAVEARDLTPKEELELINQGRCYLFDTGSDGEFNFQIRVVDAIEPVLTAKEYKKVVGASSPVILHFPTGKLCVEDVWIIKGHEPAFEVDISAGFYKCQVYIFELSNDYSFYIVLARTTQAAENQETAVSRLEPLN